MRMAIGNFEFINLSRVPEGPCTRVSRETRPGVNGCTLWDTGDRSEPIQLESVVDCADVPSALRLLEAYKAIAGGDPVALTFANDLLGGLTAVVVDVQAMSGGCHATVIGVGGVRGSSNAMLRCVWTLQPVHPTKEART